LGFKVDHVKIELGLDFDKKAVEGTTTLLVERVAPQAEAFVLDACKLDIHGVSLDGTRVSHTYDGSKLTVKFPGGGKSHRVSVEYSACPQDGIHFVGPDSGYPDREVQAWTQGETEFSRYWFPCLDRPDVKSSTELLLTVPKGFRVISNGKLLLIKDGESGVTFHWKEDLPHSAYLTSFVAGKFGEVAEEASGVQLHYYFPESKRADVLRYFGETPRMIRVFEHLTGVKYPYSKYDQTTVEDFFTGGEENFNATTLSTTYYPDSQSEEDFATSYATPRRNAVNLVAHELAHQWFGDYVTCADWSHAWLNEGFATYFQLLYVEKTRGTDQMRWEVGIRGEDYFEEDSGEYRRPIVDGGYVWPDDVFDETLYQKGACMLHELRYVVGDGAFFRGINAHLKGHPLGTADTGDFRKAMEKASGLQLGEFFDLSFFKPGFPELEAEYFWDDSTKTANIVVKQVQDTGDGTPVFKFQCDVVFYVGGKRLKRRASIESKEQRLSFALPAVPSVVELDPERWVLKRLKFGKGVQMLLDQLSQSVDASSRADAAREVGKLKSDAAVEGLKAAAMREQFWEVRDQALRALGEIGTKEALRALLAVGLPRERMVRRGLAAALGNFKEESARNMLLDLLRKDQSPYVRCEAALSLGKAWPGGALPHLKEAMKVHSPNETLAEACLAAMGKLEGEEGKRTIREGLGYGKPLGVRTGALRGIKARGAILDEEVPLLKDILLHDREFRVRLRIANEVVRPLKDARFLDAMREASKADPDLRVRRKALETYYELAQPKPQS
jgi:aminopeptidase N